MPAEQVAALKQQAGLPEGDVSGIDTPLADAIAAALALPELRWQTPGAASLRRRPNTSRARNCQRLAR